MGFNENELVLTALIYELWLLAFNTVAQLLERFKRANKDFIDILPLDNFVRAETEKLG